MIELVLVIVVFGVIVMAVSSLLQRHGQWTSAFEDVATRYGGWYAAARLFRPPMATFNYRGKSCRLRCRHSRMRRGRQETRFRIQWPDKSFYLEIVPANRPRASKVSINFVQVDTGDDVFDDAFDVYAFERDAASARRLVSSGVRWQIQQLHSFHQGEPVQVSIHKGWLVIRKMTYLKSTQPLDDFVRFSLELHDQLQLTLSDGIEFRESIIASGVEEAQCPICSSDIQEGMVVCVRCKTPHCLDCWQYNGKCGMYACDEVRFVRVGSGDPASS